MAVLLNILLINAQSCCNCSDFLRMSFLRDFNIGFKSHDRMPPSAYVVVELLFMNFLLSGRNVSEHPEEGAGAPVLSAYRVTQSFTEMEFTNYTIFHGFSENKCGNGLFSALCCRRKTTEMPERCYNTEERGSAVQRGLHWNLKIFFILYRTER